jgi:hypothetical protein
MSGKREKERKRKGGEGERERVEGGRAGRRRNRE